MQRTVQPELLDSLPPGAPAAMHNRRDLRLLNAIVGNHRWIARTLPPLLRPGERVLELGAGVGDLASRLARHGLTMDALDLWPVPSGWPESRQWHRSDLRTFSGYPRYSAFVGNLIFHQFHDGELAQLGAALRPSARLIVACEPARRPVARRCFRLIAPLFGAHPITLHDADVSIVAGFVGDELPRALGLTAPDWSVNCSISLLGLYRMVAIRAPQRNAAGEPGVPAPATHPT
ncbi:MAG TPA: hypothetical protein VG710_09970 [Opitutus sp.]|nr:hypothetical protein [Opitutus sp.]